MEGARAYRSITGDHEMELVVVGGRLLTDRCRVTVGDADITGAALRGRDRRLSGELPDGRAFSVDVTDGVALRGGYATLVVDGQVVPLRRQDDTAARTDGGLLH